MRPTDEHIRALLKEYGHLVPEGCQVTDLPLFAVNGPLVTNAIENFGRKLFCALYYKHASAVLPPRGGIALKWFTNIQVAGDEIPPELGNYLVGIPKLVRCKVNLQDQFFYRYWVSAGMDTAVFLAFFFQSFAMLGYVKTDADGIQLPGSVRVLHPFEPRPEDADSRSARSAPHG